MLQPASLSQPDRLSATKTVFSVMSQKGLELLLWADIFLRWKASGIGHLSCPGGLGKGSGKGGSQPFPTVQPREKRNKFFTREDCKQCLGWSHRVGEAKKGSLFSPTPSQSTIVELGLFALARDSLLERTRHSRFGRGLC